MSGGPGFLPSTASSCSFFGKIIILAMIFYLHSQPSPLEMSSDFHDALI